jgi:hypothetical protein
VDDTGCVLHESVCTGTPHVRLTSAALTSAACCVLQ